MTPRPDQNRRPAGGVPPSFTPQNTPGARPTSSEDAVRIKGGQAAAGPQRPNQVEDAQPIRRPVRVTSAQTPPPGTPADGSRAPGAAPRRANSTPRPAAKPNYVRSGDTTPRQGAPRQPGPRPGGPQQYAGAQQSAPRNQQPPPGAGDGSGPGRRRRRRRPALTVLGVLLILVLAWPLGLFVWASSKVNHTDALSDKAETTGQTYLLAGSDSRDDGAISDDGTEGARTDTMMLLHAPESGPTALISLPRDSYVEIPGHGSNKLNAAYTYGGAPLLVETVENLTNMKVDHYVEIGLGGVEQVVDAVGGIELCLDYVVDDRRSQLEWDEPGCQMVDGKKALSFARMRYADPKGDIGRAERQRQLISSLSSELSPALLVKPGEQVKLIGSGLDALVVDEDTGFIDMAKLGLAFRRASGSEGITGTPEISDLNYRPGGVGSAVQLNPETTPQFFDDIANGRLKPGKVGEAK